MNIKEHTYVRVFYVLNEIWKRCKCQSTALKSAIVDKKHRHLCECSLTLVSPLTSEGQMEETFEKGFVLLITVLDNLLHFFFPKTHLDIIWYKI